jgi:hypothetical protein
MALALNFNVCQEECDTLVFTELTGEYSSSNTGGWNDASTEYIGDVASATLTIIYPDGTSSDPFDMYPTFPSKTEDTELEIASTDLGLTGDFDDGVYTFTYTVTMEDTTVYTKTCYIFLSCTVDCCVDRLFARISPTDCKDCKDSTMAFALEALGFLLGAKARANCGEISAAAALLAKVQYMCNLTRCNC